FRSGRPHTRFSRDWSSDVCSSDLQSLHDSILAVLARYGITEDDSGGDTVTSVGRHGHADPVALFGTLHPIAYVIDGGRCSRGGGRCTACFDDRRSALLHDRNERFRIPVAIDERQCGFVTDQRVVQIGVLRGGVITPDRDATNAGDVLAGLLRE